MAESSDKGNPFVELLVGLFGSATFFGVPLLIIVNPEPLPVVLVWLAWGFLLIVTGMFNFMAVAGVWASSALPYGDFNPTPGGPGMRGVKYHRQLQQRMDRSPAWDWLSWKAGIALNFGLFAGSLVLVGGWLIARMPPHWDVAGAFLCFNLAAVLAALLTMGVFTGLMFLVRTLWSVAEPPERSDSPRDEGIGVGTVSPTRRQLWKAHLWRTAPLPIMLLGLIALPFVACPNVLEAVRYACLGAALAALLGYPVWVRCEYMAQRSLCDEILQ